MITFISDFVYLIITKQTCMRHVYYRPMALTLSECFENKIFLKYIVHFEFNLDFKRQVKIFTFWPVKKFHTLLISHLLLPKCPWANVWISSSPMILLSSLSERANFFILSEDFMCVVCYDIYFIFSWSRGVPWFVPLKKVSTWLTACQSNWHNSVNLIYSSSSYWQNSVNLIDSLSIKLLNQCIFDWRLVNKTVHLIDSLSIKLPNQCLFDWRLVNKIGTVLSIWLTAYQSNKWLCF